nr:IS66 family transposase [Sinorhizobium meliloti]
MSKGYRGILQVDGYAAYNKLVRSDRGNDGVTLAGCWSHSRRKFYELHVAESSKVATETVERMAKLWQIEETIRGKALRPVSRRVSTPLWLLSPSSSLSGRRPCRGSQANRSWPRRSRYAISRRAIFERFLTDGRIELDPTSSSEQSGPRRLREIMRSS